MMDTEAGALAWMLNDTGFGDNGKSKQGNSQANPAASIKIMKPQKFKNPDLEEFNPNFENTKRVKLYDYKGKNNTIVNKGSKKWLVDDYKVNNYDYKKRKYSLNQFLPVIGFTALAYGRDI